MKPWARKQIKGANANGRKKKTRTRNSSKAPDLERTLRDAPTEKIPSKFFDSRVNISITHYRSRLADPGGTSSKAAIDGLVSRSVLHDDSLLWIAEPIIETQVKVKNESEEKTVIIIEEV